MGNSSSSHHQQRQPEIPSPYAAAVVRKTPEFENSNRGLKRASNGVNSLSSTASSSNKSSSNSTSSSNGTRYIPRMKEAGKGLVMPRGGALLHGGNAPPVDSSSPGYTSPDSWGFHINITPTQELYSSSVVPAGPYAKTEGKRNHVFQNLQQSNKTNMGWTSVPI